MTASADSCPTSARRRSRAHPRGHLGNTDSRELKLPNGFPPPRVDGDWQRRILAVQHHGIAQAQPWDFSHPQGRSAAVRIAIALYRHLQRDVATITVPPSSGTGRQRRAGKVELRAMPRRKCRRPPEPAGIQVRLLDRRSLSASFQAVGTGASAAFHAELGHRWRNRRRIERHGVQSARPEALQSASIFCFRPALSSDGGSEIASTLPPLLSKKVEPELP